MKDFGNFLIFAVIALVILGVVIAYIAAMFRNFTKRGTAAREIMDHGQTCHARVVSVGRRKLTGSSRIQYEFAVDGKTFQGSTTHRSLAKGDFIEISYLPRDPSQNFPAELIESAKEKLPANFFDE